MFKKLILLMTFFVFTHPSFASEVGDLSIQELSNQVEQLKIDKENLEKNTKILEKDYWKISDFLKENIIWSELENIKEKIESTNKEIEKINKKLINEENIEKYNILKDNIIRKKADLYKYLINVIDENKMQEYYNFVKHSLQTEKERKSIVTEIDKNQKAITNKINYFQNQAQENTENLEDQIFEASAQKIKEKMNTIESNPNYKNIDDDTKAEIYEDFTNQLEDKIEELEDSNLSSSFKEMRINILKWIMNNFKDKK